MNKQKICIIGGSLTGLVTAISLSKLNCDIDLIAGKNTQRNKVKGTVAISEKNLNFLNKLDISKSLKKSVWPCSQMQLYAETDDKKFLEVFQLNNHEKKKRVLYMIENSKIIKLMLDKIKTIKSINLKNNEKVSQIENSGLLKSIKFKKNSSKYNLVIVCAGSNSDLVKNIFNNNIIENSYNELSITTILNHSSFKNNTAKQIFLNNAILAFLPLSKNRTSIVWSIKKKYHIKNNKKIKNKIKMYAAHHLKKILFKNKIEYKDLSFLIRSKYYEDRVLLFGDALHLVHPFVGQGFNMTLRDLSLLKKTLYNKINLGLDIGSEDILAEFTNEIKPRNFVYSMGIDFLKNSFSLKNKSLNKIRNNILKTLNKSNFAKEMIFNVADNGLKF